MGAIHIVTDKKNISELVLMPGDPLRAKYIAEHFLENATLVNEIRNMFAYTGTYKGVRITVMGSGMGIPSMGIYSYELIEFYNVKKIIRIGSSGSLNKDVKIRDLVVAREAKSLSSFAYQFSKEERDIEYASSTLIDNISSCIKDKEHTHIGPILTSDTFDVYSGIDHVLARLNFNDPLCVEMETYGLYHIGRIKNAEVASILTVVDSKFEPDNIVSTEDRETSLNEMITLALEALIKDAQV